jgi:hypothetical protein
MFVLKKTRARVPGVTSLDPQILHTLAHLHILRTAAV